MISEKNQNFFIKRLYQVDKMPAGVLDAVKPFLDHYEAIDGVDYRCDFFLLFEVQILNIFELENTIDSSQEEHLHLLEQHWWQRNNRCSSINVARRKTQRRDILCSGLLASNLFRNNF